MKGSGTLLVIMKESNALKCRILCLNILIKKFFYPIYCAKIKKMNWFSRELCKQIANSKIEESW